MLAAREGHAGCAARLLAAGAPPNARADRGACSAATASDQAAGGISGRTALQVDARVGARGDAAATRAVCATVEMDTRRWEVPA